MEVEETVEAAPSDDNGNLPVEDAPSEPTETPEETVETPVETTPAATEPELYELPDGRKVDAATLASEFKNNFLPEFTRKSQELATLKAPPLQPETPQNPYADPNYIPQSYDEIIRVAEERAIKTLEEREANRIAQREALETAVLEQLNEVKASDPNVNENQLFLHANKYGFKDLRVAHANMRDMAELTKKVQTTTATNIAKRNDPVSAVPGGSGTAPSPGAFGSAVEYMRSLKK